MGNPLALAAIGILVFLAHYFAGLFNKSRIPDVLPLLIIGLLLGPVFHLVSPHSFGGVGRLFTAAALVLILFQGGLDLRFSQLRDALGFGSRLTILNFMMTVAGVALMGYAALRLPLIESLTMGAILCGNAAAIVIPMIAKLRVQPVTRTGLLLESAFSDVLSIVAALGLLEAAQKISEFNAAELLVKLSGGFVFAALTGAGFGLAWAAMLHRVRRIENSILMTPALVLVVVGITEVLGYSGAIAALAFGVMLGNIEPMLKALPKAFSFNAMQLDAIERAFIDEIAFLIKSFFFVYIGLSIPLNHPSTLLYGLAITVLLFALRIGVVRWSLARAVPGTDAAICAFMVPKGLAAAVLAGLPAQRGMAGGGLIQEVVYAVVLFSVILCALLTFLFEKGQLRGTYQRWFSDYAPDPAPEGPQIPVGATAPASAS